MSSYTWNIIQYPLFNQIFKKKWFHQARKTFCVHTMKVQHALSDRQSLGSINRKLR